jgi:hypothetical protein
MVTFASDFTLQVVYAFQRDEAYQVVLEFVPEELEGAQVVRERPASALNVVFHVRVAQFVQAFRAEGKEVACSADHFSPPRGYVVLLWILSQRHWGSICGEAAIAARGMEDAVEKLPAAFFTVAKNARAGIS